MRNNTQNEGGNVLSAFKSESRETLERRILFAAATLFIESGYTAATIKKIADKAETNTGSLQNIFKSKEDILCGLVRFVLEEQFKATGKFIEGITDDKILFYAAETVLQLYMAESNENVRDLYSAAYSLPKSMEIIQNTITDKLEYIFKEHLPDLEKKDFFKLEVASGGVMRSFMTLPCNIWFQMNDKAEAFLTATFRIYRLSEEKIREAVKFVSQFDYPAIAANVIGAMVQKLENSLENSLENGTLEI